MKEPYETQEQYAPSPLEIWRQCFDIQARWSRDEERNRRGVATEEWHPPGCERDLWMEVVVPD